MKTKYLAVSSCFMYPDNSRIVFSKKSLSYLENDMGLYLSRHNALPILIPELPLEKLEHYFDQVGGLVLQGGNDLSPESYGEDFLDRDRWPGDRHRDLYEFCLIELALKKQIPILGICRGHQVLNAYFGGTLYQDIESQIPGTNMHRSAELYDRVQHQVTLKEGGLLEKIYQKKTLQVNSVHHQVIKDLAKDFVVEATSSEDQLIEAIRYTKDDNPFIFSVQWHPEFNHTLKNDLDSEWPILDEFLKYVKER